MRRFFLVLVLALFVTGLAVSGGKKEAATTDDAAGLTLWTWKIAMAPGFEAAGRLFEEATGNRVTVEAFSPDETYRQRVIAAANSGDLPDVINWWAARGLGFENTLVNLNDRVTDDFRARFGATAFNNSIVRDRDVRNWASDPQTSSVVLGLQAGDIHQIPLDVGGFFTIYANNDILREVGLEDTVPESFEQFVEFAAAAARGTNRAGFVFAGGLSDVYYNWMGRAVEASYLGVETSVGLINRQEKMSDPENIKPLLAFEEMVKADVLLRGSIAMNIDEADQAFAAGQAAYLLGGSFTFGQLSAMGMDVSNVSSFAVPLLEGSRHDQFLRNSFTLTALAISASSPNQDAAWALVEFLTADPVGAVALANDAYILPAANLGGHTNQLIPVLQNMYDGFSDEPNVVTLVDNHPDSIGRRAEWGELYNDMQRIITGDLTAREVAARFDANAAAEAAGGN